MISALDRFTQDFVTPKEGRTLIVGSKVYDAKPDRRKAYTEAVGVDLEPGEGVDVVLDLEQPVPEWLGQFDHVECFSTLEHSRKPWLMAANLELLMRAGATLHVTVPHTWRRHMYPLDCFRVLPDGLRSLFANTEWLHIKVASDELYDEDYKKLPSVKGSGGFAYLARAETCGFGTKRGP